MARPVHFEIPVKDTAKAVKFYQNAFGWKIEKWDGPVEYWLISTGEAGTPGIDGGFYTPEGPLKGVINTLGVEDLDDIIEKVQSAGGSVVAPRMPVPGIGFLAYVADPEGNLLGLMQSDPDASM